MAVADVETDCVTENKIERAFHRHIFRSLANDDGQLRFEIGLMFGKRNFDCAVVRQNRARSFKPDERRAQRRPLHLRNVIGIIQPDCH